MRIEKISNEQAELFLKNNFSAPTHWPDWNLLVKKFYKTKFNYLGYFENQELIGICPIHETKHKGFLKLKYSGQFHLIPNGGWIFSKMIKVDGEFWTKNQGLLGQNTVFTLPVLKEFNANYENVESTQKQTLVVDLKREEEDIWKTDVHSKRRNMIRKAEKEHISVDEVTDQKGLDDFYKLYYESSKKYTDHLLSKEFFEEMFFESKNINLHIFSAYQDGNQLANVAIVSDKNYSFYWLGNNNNEFRNLGQGDLLQWHTIQKMKQKGCSYYDLCYIEPEKLPAIYKFKKGFSKTEAIINLITIKTFPFKVLNKILK
jgi:sugar-specific transcriptional regulator TrmB